MGRSTLRTHFEIKRVFKEGTRFFRNGLGFYVRKPAEGKFRFAMAVPKRFGKAVARNLLRRRLRELIRLSPRLPESTDVIICVYKPCQELSFEILSKTLTWAFNKISKADFGSKHDARRNPRRTKSKKS